MTNEGRDLLPPRRDAKDFMIPGEVLPPVSRNRPVKLSMDFEYAQEAAVRSQHENDSSSLVHEAVREIAVAPADFDFQLERIRALLLSRAVETALFFSSNDLDRDGLIDGSEFRGAIGSLRWGVPDEVCDALFVEIDADASGSIDPAEYSRWVLSETLMRKASSAKQMLREVDCDGAGVLEKWQFRRAVGAMGVVAPDRALVDELFDEMDIDGSGSLDSDEIIRWIRRGVAWRRKAARIQRSAWRSVVKAAAASPDVAMRDRARGHALPAIQISPIKSELPSASPARKWQRQPTRPSLSKVQQPGALQMPSPPRMRQVQSLPMLRPQVVTGRSRTREA